MKRYELYVNDGYDYKTVYVDAKNKEEAYYKGQELFGWNAYDIQVWAYITKDGNKHLFDF